jgi:hypothetical protein
MKNLGISFGLSFAASAAFFCILYFLMKLEEHAAYSIAGLPLIASGHLCEVLERREGKRETANPIEGRLTNIYSYEKFFFAWPLTAVYGTIILLAFAEFLGGVSGILLSIFGDERSTDGVPKTIFAFLLPITVIAGYLVGRWIGSRSRRGGVVAIFLVAPLSAILDKTVESMMISSDDFKQLYGVPETFGAVIEHTGATAAILLVTGLVGYWRGRRMRFSKYLRYLLGILPSDTRDTLMGLAYEEALKVMSRRAAA